MSKGAHLQAAGPRVLEHVAGLPGDAGRGGGISTEEAVNQQRNLHAQLSRQHQYHTLRPLHTVKLGVINLVDHPAVSAEEMVYQQRNMHAQRPQLAKCKHPMTATCCRA